MIRQIAGWLGRRVGWGLKSSWEIFKGIAKWFGFLLIVIIAAILTSLGQFVLLFLGALGALCLIFLKGFAWLTYRLMIGTRWLGSHVTTFTENFFQGVLDTFKQEEEFLSREIQLTIKLEES